MKHNPMYGTANVNKPVLQCDDVNQVCGKCSSVTTQHRV